MLQMMEKYTSDLETYFHQLAMLRQCFHVSWLDLETVVAERTRELTDEKARIDRLLNNMMPALVSIIYS